MDTPYTQGFKAGMAYENERIIKLLEPEVERHQQLLLNASAGYLQGLIELIKGETNE